MLRTAEGCPAWVRIPWGRQIQTSRVEAAGPAPIRGTPRSTSPGVGRQGIGMSGAAFGESAPEPTARTEETFTGWRPSRGGEPAESSWAQRLRPPRRPPAT
jgi:hypothetical protein